MVSFSKYYQDHILKKSCQTLLIHTDSCRSHCLKDIPLYLLSNLKYFAPVCLIPALIRLRQMNKNKFRNTLEYYLGCSLFGAAVGYTTNFFMCLLRNLLGQFGFYTFIFIPAMIGAFPLNLASPRVVQLFHTSIFQCNFDSFFLMRGNFISRAIADSRILQTYVFMLCSALILQGKQLYDLKGFWLLSPNRKLPQVENQEQNKCELHDETKCRDYLLRGIRKYLALGLTLDIIKTLMSKVDATQNTSKLMGKLRNFRLRSTVLFTTYLGIYRFTHCFLNRHFNNPDSLNHFTSAFFAGFCYYFYPQWTLFSYALVQAISTLWSMIKIENSNTKNSILQFVFGIPFAKIVFPFALANTVHLVCLRPEYCSSLTSTIANGVTNNYPNHIKNELLKLQQRVKEGMAK